MQANLIRDKYIRFFEKQDHKRISPAPLVLENDPSTLFTSSGMQPLVPYLLGDTHPAGKRLVNCQPAIRTQDIDEVGDNRHTTFFNMLGNWSLGDYFKQEQLSWIWDFLTQELGLEKKRLYVSVFKGDNGIPRDQESYEIWKSLGVDESRIYEYEVDKNWWSRSGSPQDMPEGEIGGPDSEIFFDFGPELLLHESSKWKDEVCHPNCDCGRFLEIGNSVFIQYVKRQGKLELMEQKNVDFGGGLERLVMATEEQNDIFKTSVFAGLIGKAESATGLKYGSSQSATQSLRIIAEHLRACEALVSSGVLPGNKQQGYVLRRLIRKAAIALNSAKPEWNKSDLSFSEDDKVNKVVEQELAKFRLSLKNGLAQMKKYLQQSSEKSEINPKKAAKKAFDLYQTFGLPKEIFLENLTKNHPQPLAQSFAKDFVKNYDFWEKEHSRHSRRGARQKFRGGLADKGIETTKLHTVTHLIHESLRRVLGKHVQQKGSNITSERLRFDFSHPDPMTEKEIRLVEKMVNEQIDKSLKVTKKIMSLEEAKSEGALAFFTNRYENKVSVYFIGDFSKEVCGGPHVKNLKEVGGHVKIIKEKSASSGVRRIYAQIVE